MGSSQALLLVLLLLFSRSFFLGIENLVECSYAPINFVGDDEYLEVKNTESDKINVLVGVDQNRTLFDANDGDDFTGLNIFLSKTKMNLPDMHVMDLPSPLPESSSVKISNFVCEDLGILSLEDQIETFNSPITLYTIVVHELNVNCNFDYVYMKGWFTEDDGRAQIYTRTDKITVELVILSEPIVTSSKIKGDEIFPTEAATKSCSANVNVLNMDFSGGLRAGVLDLIERRLRDNVGGQIEELLCTNLETTLTNALTNFLNTTFHIMTPYYKDVYIDVVDPLYQQHELNTKPPDDDVNLLDFTDAKLFESLREKVDAVFGTMTHDPHGPNSETTGMDLGINILMRSNVLDEDRALQVPEKLLAQLMIAEDNLSISPFFNIHLAVNSIKVYGLDAFTSFDNMEAISSQTFQSHLHLSYVDIESDLVFWIQPTEHQQVSTEKISVDVPNHVENINVKVGIRGIDAKVANLLALDLNKLFELQVYNLLNLNHYIPCIAWVLYDAEITRLQVSIENIDPPSVQGLFAPGIDSLVDSLSEGLNNLYGDMFHYFIPNLVATKVREQLNDNYRSKSFVCPSFSSNEADMSDEYVDFRFLLSNDTSSLFPDTQNYIPYGGMLSILINIFHDYVRKTDNDGNLKINKAVLAPFTMTQSGSAGSWILAEKEENLYQLKLGRDDYSVSFKTSDVRIENLDTVGVPIEILRPRQHQPYILDNKVAIGIDNPIRFAANILIDIQIDKVRIANQVDVKIDIKNIIVWTSLLMKVNSSRFMRIPVKHMTNLHCWLSTISGPPLDKNGYPIKNSSTSKNFAVEEFRMSARELKVNAECVSCDIDAFDELSNILSIFDSLNVMDEVLQSVIKLVDEVMKGEMMEIELARILFDAENRCLNVQNENGVGNLGGGYDRFQFDTSSGQFIETSIFLGLLFIEVGVILASIQFSSQETTSEKDRLSSEILPFIPNSETITDFTDMSTRVGIVLQMIIDFLNENLGGIENDPKDGSETLGLNLLIRSKLLDENGIFAYMFPKDSSISLSGVELHSIVLKEFDSFTFLELFVPRAPHVLESRFRLESLSADIILRIGNDDDQKEVQWISLPIILKKLEAFVTIFAVVDEAKIELINLGSIMHFDGFVKCALSCISAMHVTRLDLTTGDIQIPETQGLSKNVTEALFLATDTLLNKYANDIQMGLKYAFDSVLRNTINDYLKEEIFSSAHCPEYSFDGHSEFIDFREVMMNTNTSIGRDSWPYGNLSNIFFTQLINWITSPSESGQPYVNNILKGFTEIFSGTPGAISLESANLENFVNSLFDASDFGVDVHSIILENIDSVGYPIELLQPIIDRPFAISNTLTIGTSGNPLLLQTRLSIKHNLGQDDISIFLHIENIMLWITLLVKMRTRAVLEMRILDVANIDCWLATMTPPMLSVYEFCSNDSLLIDNVNILIDNLTLTLKCNSCVSSGLENFNEIISSLGEVGVVDALKDHLLIRIGKLIEGSKLQSFIKRTLIQASRQCPYHSLSKEGDLIPQISNPDASNTMCTSPLNLSEDDVDFVLSIGIVLLEVAAVVVAMGVPSDSSVLSNPYPDYSTTDFAHNSGLLDYTEPGSPVGSMIQRMLELLNEAFQEVKSDPNVENDKDLALNNFLRSSILDSKRSLLKNFNKATPISSIQLESVRILGLDSFTSFGGFTPVLPQVIQSYFNLKYLTIEAIFSQHSINFSPPTNERTNREEQNEFVIRLRLENINFMAVILLALDQELINEVQLGSILDSTKILKCLLSCITKTEITRLLVSVGQISWLQIRGAVQGNLNHIVNTASNLLIQEYREYLLNALPIIFDSWIRKFLNREIDTFLALKGSEGCTDFRRTTHSSSLIDFRDLFLSPKDAKSYGASGLQPYGDLLVMFRNLIHDALFAPDEDGYPKMNNRLLASMTKVQSNTSGTLFFPDDLFEQSEGADANDSLVFQLRDLKFENVDSFSYPLTFLKPKRGESSVLENEGVMGLELKPLIVSAKIIFKIQGDYSNIENVMDVSLEMRNLGIHFPILAKINEKSFLSLTLQELPNFFCWLKTFQIPELDEFGKRKENSEITAALLNINFNVTDIHLSVNCIKCTGPAFVRLGNQLNSQSGQESSTSMGKFVLNQIRDILLSGMLQRKIDRLLNEAINYCSFDPVNEVTGTTYASLQLPILETEAMNITVGLVIVIVAFFLMKTLFRIYRKMRVRRQHICWLNSLSKTKIEEMSNEQLYVAERENCLRSLTKAMCHSEDIPKMNRILIPIIIICNIFLFVSGHLSVAATTRFDILVGGQDIVIQNARTFSVAKTIRGMWIVGLNTLAIVMFLCSVIWPYLKQIVLLILWFLPPRVLSAMKREKIILKLDSFGKWSMIDIYTVIITLIVFRIKISSPKNHAFIPNNAYGIDMMIVPLWGLYANLLAQIISQLSSHYIIYCHRKIVANGYKSFDKRNDKTLMENHFQNELDAGDIIVIMPEDVNEFQIDGVSCNSADLDWTNGKESLRTHKFKGLDLQKSNYVSVRSSTNIFVGILGCLTALLLLLGCLLPSFQLEIFGLIGVIIDAGNGSNNVTYRHSVITIAGVMISQAFHIGTVSCYLGMILFALLFIATSLIVPVVLVMMLLLLWYFPMEKSRRENLVVMIEILQSWQYVDVYIIASFLGMWQMGTISESMVRRFCLPLDDLFASLSFFELIDEGNARCFYTKASLDVGAYLLFAATLMLTILTDMIVRAEEQRRNEEKQNMIKVKAKRWLKTEEKNRIPLCRELLAKSLYSERHFTDVYSFFVMNNILFEDSPTASMHSVQKTSKSRSFDSGPLRKDQSMSSLGKSVKSNSFNKKKRSEKSYKHLRSSVPTSIEIHTQIP